jgi:CRISPR-associated endoribonuclease Cas6
MHYGSYRFTCTLLDNALLPPFRGSTFRGAFGVALKNVVCALRRNSCDGCLLVGRCIYARTFEIQRHAPEANRSRVVTPPHPYIICSPFAEPTRMSAGDEFSFDLILFGEANEWLPYFICAFDAMEATGIGKKIERHRSRFTVTSVTSGDVTVYAAIDKVIRPGTLSHDVPFPVEGSEGEGTLTMTLTTPLRLKNDNRFSSTLSFELLQRAVLRRVSALHVAFGDGDPPLDYRGLVSAAGKVEILSSMLQWQDWRRWSNRQDDEMSLGGLIGTITYQGAIGRFLPLIEQARLFHLGKQTSFGLGAFDYSWLPTGGA